MQTHPNSPQSGNSGFTLLEVMIALVIFSIGLIGLASLQGRLVFYDALAKQRTWAMNAAEKQIETMRSFTAMASTGAGACAIDPVAYDDLTTCTTETTVNLGNVNFRLTWDITAYEQNADGTHTVFTSGGSVLRPHMKLVTLTAAWTDSEGITQSVQIKDVIDSTPRFNNGRLLAKVESNLPPTVPFETSDFPGVVEIAMGDDKLKGSTTPEPEIENKGVNVITTFDVVTYMHATETAAYLQRREEFKVSNCICTMDAGVGSGRAPTVWNGAEYVLGAELSKRTGSVSTNVSGQPAECDLCCNNHHDAAGASIEYDPFRPDFTGDAGSFNFLGDHAHYDIVNGDKILATEGDDYLEVCRFIRKGGFFQVTTDMSLENFDTIQESYPTDYNADYSTSVVSFITDFTDQLSVDDYPAVIPDPTYSSAAPGLFFGNAGVIKPAMSRGIYLDFLEPDLLRQIKCLRAGGTGPYSNYCDVGEDPAWQELIPFFDLDVTALAGWSPGSTAVEVTNSPISDIDSQSFSRGEVSLAQSHFDVETTVTASIEPSNSGLTDTNSIDPHDENEESAPIPVSVQIGGIPPAAGILVLGDIDPGSGQINIETTRVSQDPPAVNCEIFNIVEGNSSQKSYICDLAVDGGGIANGTVTISDYNALKVTGHTTTVLNRKVCPGGSDFSGAQVIDDGVMADPDLGIVGERTVLSFTNLAADATVDITIVKQTTNCP